MADQRLINAYKRARELIAETPQDKEYIINEYIDLVEKINNYYNGGGASAGGGNDGGGLANMLKNPLEIEIYNNFQRYGVGSSVPMSAVLPQDGPATQQLTFEQGADILLNVSEYMGNLN
jgi:hypothetical protein